MYIRNKESSSGCLRIYYSCCSKKKGDTRDIEDGKTGSCLRQTVSPGVGLCLGTFNV